MMYWGYLRGQGYLLLIYLIFAADEIYVNWWLPFDEWRQIRQYRRGIKRGRLR